MGADYSFELISIETYAPQFIGHNKVFLGSVYYSVFQKLKLSKRFECAHDLLLLTEWKILKNSDESWCRKVDLKIRFCHFLTNCHSLYSQNTIISFEHVNLRQKILLLRTSKKFHNHLNHEMCGYQAPCRSRISMEEKNSKKVKVKFVLSSSHHSVKFIEVK